MSIIVEEVNLNPKGLFTPVNLPDCYTKIAEIAFYKAESRGFEPGHELEDWLEAEREFIAISTKNIDHEIKII
jgi:hypothetical protein